MVHEQEFDAKHDPEALVHACAPSRAERTLDGSLLTALLVESVVDGNSAQRGRPNTVRRVDEETPGQAGKTETDKVGTEGTKELVSRLTGILHVEVLWGRQMPTLKTLLTGHGLNEDEVLGRRVRHTENGHDVDQHVLLLVEFLGWISACLAPCTVNARRG